MNLIFTSWGPHSSSDQPVCLKWRSMTQSGIRKKERWEDEDGLERQRQEWVRGQIRKYRKALRRKLKRKGEGKDTEKLDEEEDREKEGSYSRRGEGGKLSGDPALGLGLVHAPLRLICIMLFLASLKLSRGAGNILPGDTCESLSSSFSSFPRYCMAAFHHHSLALPPTPHLTFPHSAYQKHVSEIKGTSDSLHPSPPLIHHP